MAKLLATVIRGDLTVRNAGNTGPGAISGDGYSISNIRWSNIVETPTTIAGYKITDAFTKTEIEAMFNAFATGLDWKESVATFNDIATTYPNPEDGWTVNVKDTDITYRYDGTKWIEVSANTIPMASRTVDGKMSKEDFGKLEDHLDPAKNKINGNKHIPAGGEANQWLKWSELGTSKWEALPQSSTSAQGIVQLNNTYTSTSITQAATANMVKTLKDQIDSLAGGGGGTSAYVRKSGDQMTGNLTFSSSANIGVYHNGGTKGMIRRGATDNTTIVGNDSGATVIQSSANPRIKVGAAAETEIFHMGRKADLSKSETVGILPISQGGTGRGSYPTPTTTNEGFLRWNGTGIETFTLTLDDIGPGGGGEGGTGGEALDAVYLRRDGALPMTGTLNGTSANFTGTLSATGKLTGGSIETLGTLKAGASTLGTITSSSISATGTISSVGSISATTSITGNTIVSNTTITATGAIQGSVLKSTSGEININGIKLVKNTTENSLDFVFE